MPCISGGPEEDLAYTRKELDEVTRYLCQAMGFIEHNNLVEFNNSGLHDLYHWWQKHKARDAQRALAKANAEMLDRKRAKAQAAYDEIMRE